MESIKLILIGIAQGVFDSICGTAAIFYVDKPQEEVASFSAPKTVLAARRSKKSLKVTTKKEPQVLNRILKCCGLNGGIFLASIVIFNNIIMPLLQLFMEWVFSHSPGMSRSVWTWFGPLLSCIFSALWILPIFLLSKIVNCLWFQDIADSAYRSSRGRPKGSPNISTFIAENLFSILIQALFLVQGMLMSLLPYAALGQLISIVHTCLLYSLYAFEYKWCNMGVELHKRLLFIEKYWPYFLGFGLPLAVLTSLPSSFLISGCVFSILFPLLIISSNEAKPYSRNCNIPIKFFTLVVRISNAMFSRAVR